MIRLSQNILKHHVFHRVTTELGPLHALVLLDLTMTADGQRGVLADFQPTTLKHLTDTPDTILADLIRIGAITVEHGDLTVVDWFDFLPGEHTALHRAANHRRMMAERWTQPKEKPVHPVEKVASPPKPDPISPQAIIDLYHKHLPDNPSVRVISENTKSTLRARIREDRDRLLLEWWEQYFKYAGSCDWLTGRIEGSGNRKPFKADFQWLIGPQNMEKVINGRY